MAHNNYQNNKNFNKGNTTNKQSTHQQISLPLSNIPTNDTYVDDAEKVINYLKEKGCGKIKLTTSKIRNILAMCADIYNQIIDQSENGQDKLSDELKSKVDYLRVKCIYEAGRERDVKDFIDAAKIIDLMKEINGSKEKFKFFNHYMEALVAYHRYLGGND